MIRHLKTKFGIEIPVLIGYNLLDGKYGDDSHILIDIKGESLYLQLIKNNLWEKINPLFKKDGNLDIVSICNIFSDYFSNDEMKKLCKIIRDEKK